MLVTQVPLTYKVHPPLQQTSCARFGLESGRPTRKIHGERSAAGEQIFDHCLSIETTNPNHVMNMKYQILLLTLLLASGQLCLADYHTNTITTPNDSFAFSVDGSDPVNPTIELQAGVTNILNIQTYSDHPVVITSTLDTSDWFAGADPQGYNFLPITLVTPADGFPETLYYMCYYHGFYGTIHFTAATGSLPPPPNTILEIHVGTNVVMTSTGTNTTWQLIPQYSSNLCSGVWAPVPNFTNYYSDGTNTTIFPRLDPICGPNVFLRTVQQPK